MTTRVHGEVRIRWPVRARRRLLPSRRHDLAIFDAEPALPLVQSCRLAATAFAALPTRRTIPQATLRLVERLRRALVPAAAAAFEAARAAVGEPAGVLARGLLAGAFTGVAEWTSAAARAYLERPRPEPLIEVFGPFVTDPEIAMELVVASARSPYGLRERGLDLLAHLGPSALPALRYMLFERWSDSSVRPVARAVGLVESESAGRALLPLLGSRSLAPTARAWARRHRDLAIPLLRDLATDPTDDDLDLAQRDSLEAVVEPLLRELDPPAPLAEPWPEDAPAPLREGPGRAPSFVTPERLPRLRARGGAALPSAASARLVAILSDGGPLRAVASGCDPGSLAGFAHAAYEAWRAHGGDGAERWVFDALSFALDDLRAAELAAEAEEAHRSGRAHHAVRLLDALARRGTPRALMYVERVARTTDYAKLRATARAAIARAAEASGLDPWELGDRAMPSLDLGPGGVLTLDLGPRSLRLFCDETLTPKLRDEKGRVRDTFPAPRKADDPGLHARAKERFVRVRREAKLVREALCHRLERMMIHRRRVPLEAFRERFVSHPLVRLLVERLVLETPGARLRLAEDGTFADLEDRERDVEPGAPIGVAHPIHLSPEERAAWAERFADYSLVQPFRQLGRPVYSPTEEERAAGHLLRLEGRTLEWERFAELRRRGWTGRSADGIRVSRLERELIDVTRLAIELAPGLHVGSPVGSGPQRLSSVTIEHLAELDPVLSSEAMLTLERLYR